MEYSEVSNSVAVSPGLLTDLLTFLYAPPDPRPYAGGRPARLDRPETTSRMSMACKGSGVELGLASSTFNHGI
jgi:hypothetical protein